MTLASCRESDLYTKCSRTNPNVQLHAEPDLWQQDVESVPQHDEILKRKEKSVRRNVSECQEQIHGTVPYSVVSNITGSGPQMNDGSRAGAAVCEGVDVRHHVVPEFTLLFSRHGEVDVVGVRLHLLDLSVSDGQTQNLGGGQQRDSGRFQ